MSTRIATNFQNASTLSNLQAAASKMEATSYQVTSGYKAKTLAEESSDAQQILNLRDIQTRTESYLSNLSSASSTVKATENALQSMTDLLTDANNLVTEARNANDSSTRAALAPKAQSLAESFYSLMQSQFNGTYLFSGSDGATSPISGTPAATAYPGSPLSTSWYQGDTQLASTISGAGLTLQYGVLGNSDAFAKFKAGLESLWYGLKNNDTTQLDNATSALGDAKTGITSLLGETGGQLNSISLLESTHTSQKEFVSNQLDDLEKVDMSSALTTYSAQQATLQASMMVISKLSQLSLLDYLR